MSYTWNNKNNKRHFERVKRYALEDKRYNFTPDELASPYLDKLSHQTRSFRIMRMITLAYYLGKLKGIQEMDEGLTPVTLS